jgi:hypothetical protein
MSLSPLAEYQLNRFNSLGEALLSCAVNSNPALFKKEKALHEVSVKVGDTALQFTSQPRLNYSLKVLWKLKTESRVWHLLDAGFSCKSVDKDGYTPLGCCFYNHWGKRQPSVPLIKRIVDAAPELINKAATYCQPSNYLPMLGWYYKKDELEQLKELLMPK